MSDKKLPSYIDCDEILQSGQQIQGCIRVSELTRLTDLLCDDTGVLQVKCNLYADEEGYRHLTCTFSGILLMQCQRCLEPVAKTISSEVDLILVANEKLVELVPNKFNAIVVPDNKLVIREVIEDEVILSLPMFARHEEPCCIDEQVANSTSETLEPTKSNPFKVLEKLKKGDH